MKSLLLVMMMLGVGTISVAQRPDYVPFSEATNAIQRLEEAPVIKDSLKRIYIERVTLGFTFGQRFISGSNKTETPDTITFTDFSDRRGFIGLAVGYFLKNHLQLSMSGNLLMLPREQEISSVQFGGANGISIEGEGSGGAMITNGFEGRYYFKESSLTRPYVKLEAGFIRALAVGGTGGFTVGQGQFQNRKELQESYRYLQPGIGFAHRMARQALLDFNLSYLFSADRSRNIGGITSPGGISASFGFHFVFGSNK